ncbi:hypothetical protein B2G71_17605 [Novosphingobium sp. PC22D]|uniref:MFS transporter n=1 Tax=Novosphingobium sp. PC22D TaxID=1962403 RepID=UPI000BF20057|nr:MFS transporter [Novosphingobium sp. PC22D]PEQ11369.1 hypothetical protein B2G71_17605 [Novosphingobium sp. PC22D]
MTKDKAHRIGPIVLAPGITAREVFVFLTVTGIASTLTAFLNVMQPFVYSEVVGIGAEQQGRLAGQLMTVQQFSVILFVGLAGALSDRIGRKILLLAALLGFCISALVYPIISGVLALFVIRIFFGISSTFHTASGPAKFFDYPDNGSRGKFMALVMIWMAILAAALIGGVGAHLPGWLQAAGASAREAGTWALWLAAALGLGVAAFGALFMMNDRPAKRPEAKPGLAGFVSGFREVMAQTRGNRSFATLVVTSFVVRTDDAVIASFLALWVTIQGAREGLSTVHALEIAGVLTAIIRFMHLLVPPILGPLLDRFSRLAMYLVSIASVGAVFVCAPLVGSVSGWGIYVFAILVGTVEASQTICQQAFFGQEAPSHLRATAYSLLAIFGTVSVIGASLAAGYLFDAIGPTAPFTLIGLLHVAAVILSLAVLGLMGRGRRAAG